MKLSLLEKYHMFFSQCTSPRSSDFTRTTIYHFDRWCRCCGAGMVQPARHEQRAKKMLWSGGVCSALCFNNESKKVKIGNLWKENAGAESSFSRTVSDSQSFKFNSDKMDAMIELSICVDAEESRTAPFQKLVKYADMKFKMLSEKLSFMEVETGENWSSSKFYFWLHK